MKAPAISHDLRNRELTIDNLIRTYLRLAPRREVDLLLRYVQLLRDNPRKPEGRASWSPLVTVAQIPTKLVSMMNFVFGPEWRNHEPTFRIFMQKIKKLRVNDKVSLKTRPDALTEFNHK